jgi:cobalt transporter subunit CbtB
VSGKFASESHWSNLREGGSEQQSRKPGDLPPASVSQKPSGGGQRIGTMTTSFSSLGASVGRQSRLMQLALAGLLGFFIVGFVGFSHLDVVHNAAHDYRHSMAFPCH